MLKLFFATWGMIVFASMFCIARFLSTCDSRCGHAVFEMLIMVLRFLELKFLCKSANSSKHWFKKVCWFMIWSPIRIPLLKDLLGQNSAFRMLLRKFSFKRPNFVNHFVSLRKMDSNQKLVAIFFKYGHDTRTLRYGQSQVGLVNYWPSLIGGTGIVHCWFILSSVCNRKIRVTSAIEWDGILKKQKNNSTGSVIVYCIKI